MQVSACDPDPYSERYLKKPVFHFTSTRMARFKGQIVTSVGEACGWGCKMAPALGK